MLTWGAGARRSKKDTRIFLIEYFLDTPKEKAGRGEAALHSFHKRQSSLVKCGRLQAILMAGPVRWNQWPEVEADYSKWIQNQRAGAIISSEWDLRKVICSKGLSQSG